MCYIQMTVYDRPCALECILSNAYLINTTAAAVGVSTGTGTFAVATNTAGGGATTVAAVATNAVVATNAAVATVVVAAAATSRIKLVGYLYMCTVWYHITHMWKSYT